MAKKRLEELPVVGDTIVFELATYATELKLPRSAYAINRISIYHIRRDGSGGEIYYKTAYSKDSDEEIRRLELACAEDPSPKKVEELERARVRREATSIKRPYKFKDGEMIFTVGEPSQPVYKGADSIYVKNTGVGLFEFEWDTTLQKEGDYYIVWSWVPEQGGKEITAQRIFSLYLTPAPFKAMAFVQATPTDKYDFLLKKYLPSMYKTKVMVDDVTSEVIEGLNWCVAREFTYLENVLGLLTECYDANLCPPNMLQLLANFYGIKLRTDNVVLQRRQAKNAIPLLQAKGTKEALETALSQAGIRMKKLSLLWQVVSPYTWTESFTIQRDDEFYQELSKRHVNGNLKVEIRSQVNSEYLELPQDYFLVVDSLDGSKKTLIFQNDLSGSVRLLKGDYIRITYEIKEMPPDFRQLQDYIKSLPLADQRDETRQAFPLKNWNVHLIEEDDPLFPVLIKERHPFYDPLTYGRIRTTFLFSENVYNMDTFNGSLRESKEPCHIDRFFLDECTACRSGSFNLDIEIEELSDHRINEAIEIINEYSPFHAQLNTLNICGAVNEFLVMPHEEIELLVDYSTDDGNEITDTMTHQEEIACKIEYADGRVETIKL